MFLDILNILGNTAKKARKSHDVGMYQFLCILIIILGVISYTGIFGESAAKLGSIYLPIIGICGLLGKRLNTKVPNLAFFVILLVGIFLIIIIYTYLLRKAYI